MLSSLPKSGLLAFFIFFIYLFVYYCLFSSIGALERGSAGIPNIAHKVTTLTKKFIASNSKLTIQEK